MTKINAIGSLSESVIEHPKKVRLLPILSHEMFENKPQILGSAGFNKYFIGEINTD